MTVFLTDRCPRQTCTVDITPRHVKRFKPAAGDRFVWSRSAGGAEGPAERGTVTADRWGLVTVRQVTVEKARSRILIERKR
jgi:hypothetical protein